jgi:hypothetical protein
MGPVVATSGTIVVSVVVLAPVTLACTPLNVTVFAPKYPLKFVPVIVIVLPPTPLVGVKPEIVGGGITVKLDPLVADCPPTVTLIGPVVAPAGTTATRDVAVALVTLAATPLKPTVFAEAVVLKLAPEIVTWVPTPPLVGVNPDIVGGGTTVKFDALVAVCPATVTLIGPVAAPVGTLVVIEVVLELVTVAVTPLKLTLLAEGVVLKFVPEIVTDVPIPPVVGVKPAIVGGYVI